MQDENWRKSKLNISKEKRKINRPLKRSYYDAGREWPYKNVEPLIISEEFLSDKTKEEIQNYRVFCFNGEPKFITVDLNTTDINKTKRNIYDLDWNLLSFGITYPR